MTDYFEQQIDEASRWFSRSCFRPRYRVAWLTGKPQSGKSILARRLCQHHQWRYLDYTLTSGYFDQLGENIILYQPDDFTRDLRQWCESTIESVLVVDEIDSMLAFWSYEQRRMWLASIARLAGLSRGLILITHFFEPDQILSFHDGDPYYCFNLSGE